MKNNSKISKLMKNGISERTLSKLSESQIDTLYNKLFLSEQIKRVEKVSIEIPRGAKPEMIEPMPKGATASSKPDGTIVLTPKESEMKEEDEITFDPDKETETQDPHQVGPSTDDGFTDSSEDGMGIFEERKKRKRKKINPWAICTSQMGKEFKTTERHLWNTKQKNKYERCVRDVKKSLKENKNPVSLFLENQIMKIVERNLPPKITKKDLIKYLQEDTTTAPKTKPKEPKTKPSEKPKTRPSHPGKNPNPGENPAPKAISPERAKDEIIKAIMKILDK